MFQTLTSYIPFRRQSVAGTTPAPLIGWSAKGKTLSLAPVKVHDVETAAEKRARTLKHLIKANHAIHAVIYHELRFHNHCTHILGSAYIFGGTSEHLTEIYEEEEKHLEPWRDSPAEITQDDWRDFLGQREYQRAYVDFFEDQLVKYKYDWHKLLDVYFLTGANPLINNMICGLGHPLIHLGYSHELNSRDIGIEALALTTCFYDDMHKYLDDPQYTSPPPDWASGASPMDLLGRIRTDERFDGLFDAPGSDNMGKLLAEHEKAVLEYWNSWEKLADDPTGQFAASQRAAVALLVGSHPAKADPRFDFFLVHLLTTSHAVRILLPTLAEKWQVSVVRQWWLFVVVVYICQLRPEIDEKRIQDVDLEGRDWKFVNHKALTGEPSLDAHFVKALRAMKEAGETWGDADQFYLKAAVKFATDFDHWGGFGTRSEGEDDVMSQYSN